MRTLIITLMLLTLSSCATKQPVQPTNELSQYTLNKLNELSKKDNPTPNKMNQVVKASLMGLDSTMQQNFASSCYKEINTMCKQGEHIVDCMYKNRNFKLSNVCSYSVSNAFGHQPLQAPANFYNLTIPAGSTIYKDKQGNIEFVKLSRDIVYKAIVFSKDRKLTIRKMDHYNGYIDNPFVIEKGLAISTIYIGNKSHYSPTKSTSFNEDGTIKK